MEHTHKMYLVPQHQLDALKHTPPRDSVRQTAENELDKAIATVLNTPSTDLYEKAARYGAVLQRYLSLVKQGQREHGELTLSLADGGPVHTPVAAQHGVDDDDGIGDHIYGYYETYTRQKQEQHQTYPGLFKEIKKCLMDGQGGARFTRRNY